MRREGERGRGTTGRLALGEGGAGVDGGRDVGALVYDAERAHLGEGLQDLASRSLTIAGLARVSWSAVELDASDEGVH